MNGLGVALLTLASATMASAQTVLVPRGTDVPLMFVDRVTSNGAHEGQMVGLKVAKNVFVNGILVIPAGTPVTATVKDIEKQGRFGKNAKMEFSINPLRVSNQLIELQDRQKGLHFQGGNTGNAALASGAGAVLLGPIGLLAGWGVVGKPVVIEPGHKVETEVDETVAVTLRS